MYNLVRLQNNDWKVMCSRLWRLLRLPWSLALSRCFWSELQESFHWLLDLDSSQINWVMVHQCNGNSSGSVNHTVNNDLLLKRLCVRENVSECSPGSFQKAQFKLETLQFNWRLQVMWPLQNGSCPTLPSSPWMHYETIWQELLETMDSRLVPVVSSELLFKPYLNEWILGSQKMQTMILK